MQRHEGDAEISPRPTKRRHIQDDVDPPQRFSPRAQSDMSSEVESHRSGRISPTKQLAYLEDREDPVIYCDFGSTRAEMQEDVQNLHADVQSLSDGVGILGYEADELASLTAAGGALETNRERDRFRYPWANDLGKRRKTGNMVPLADIQSLITAAITCEYNRSHENTWNEEVHLAVLMRALASSPHAACLDVTSTKTASIDPPELIDEPLSKRVVDYAIVLRPDAMSSRAWRRLLPLGKASVKSWNHTTTNDLRTTPIAANTETKAPNKSWTDGIAQLGIWTTALFKRLSMLQEPGCEPLRIPAMPLLIAQGHDWHLLIISQQPDKGGTVIWQKIDVGNTRNLFDTYKLIAVIHLVMSWAYTTWRPWFHGLIQWMDP
ncbi:MAG: hypothetical protein Q9166_007848 [cf. Caloplaca sp. 2 TL-2023]